MHRIRSMYSLITTFYPIQRPDRRGCQFVSLDNDREVRTVLIGSTRGGKDRVCFMNDTALRFALGHLECIGWASPHELTSCDLLRVFESVLIRWWGFGLGPHRVQLLCG